MSSNSHGQWYGPEGSGFHAQRFTTRLRAWLMHRYVGLAAGSLVTVAVIAIGGYSIAQAQLGKRWSGYALDVTPPDPVEVHVGETVEMIAQVRSLRSEPVTIVGCAVPCGCLEVGPLPMTIPPGADTRLCPKTYN